MAGYMGIGRRWTLGFAFALLAGPLHGDGLVNPGFEEESPTAGWELNVFGEPPVIVSDAAIAHEGHRSLRIEALQTSDTALGREISLKPGQWYRFRGWVRTQGLDPHGSATSATLQVQHPLGRGVFASGRSHSGDTDWTEVGVHFQAPPDGRVRLCLFFVGFGRGTGTVWFDDLQLDEVSPGNAPLRITRQPLVNASISPLQYGQFVEYLCDLVPSMWSEQLFDGGFEGLSPYKMAFIAETDFKEKSWYPVGAVNRATYSLDRTNKVGGATAKRIDVEEGAPATVGLAQDGLYVERGRLVDFSVWLRAERLSGPVQVTLRHEERVFATTRFSPTTNWQKFTTRFAPSGTDANASLTIEFRGPGNLWLDQASLMPADSVGGWRRDVVEAVRALRPGVIRFGGSALDDASLGEFEWKDTLGDRDHRRPFWAWGGLQPTAAGLEEFVQFCRAVNAEPLICVRFSKRSARDAAEEVQYFNGTTNTPMGGWRARNGHPAPYGIRFWQVGNERESPDYDAQVAGFCTAMKTADPSIQIFSSFPTAGSLRQAGEYFDYVCPHHYTPDLGACESDLERIRGLLQLHAPGRPIKVAVTEWNTTAGDWGLRRAMLMTQANALACSRYHHLLHRHCDLVEIANRSNLINSFGSGIIQADNHRLYRTPTYYAQQLYATLAGTQPLRLESDWPVNVGLDHSATLSADGRTLTLFAVNDTLDDITRTLDLSAFRLRGRSASVWTLADRERAGEPDVRNSFADPERISVRRSQVHSSGPGLNYHFPALSLTALQWSVESPRQ